MLHARFRTPAPSFRSEQLGLDVVEEYPTMVAMRAGGVRFSIFAGGRRRWDPESEQPATVMLRTKDLDATIAELAGRGVEFDGEIQTAPGFMRYVSLLDPDGNQLYIAHYLGDPLRRDP